MSITEDTTRATRSVRACADAIHEILDRHNGNPAGDLPAAKAAVETLLQEPGLWGLGRPRKGMGGSLSYLIYCDPDLGIFLGQRDPVEPPHDHGGWQLFGCYTGSIHHVAYRRLDDRQKPGVAKIEISEDRTLTPGEVVLIPLPPEDIHQVELSPDATSLVITNGKSPATRKMFDVNAQTYSEKEVNPFIR